MATALNFGQRRLPIPSFDQLDLGRSLMQQVQPFSGAMAANRNAMNLMPLANTGAAQAQPVASGSGPAFRFQDLNKAYQLDPRNTLAKALMEKGMRGTPIRSPLEGIGRLSQSLVGAMLQKKSLDRLEGQETTRQENLQAQQDAITATLPANLQSMFTGPATAQSLASVQQLNLQKELAPTSEFAIKDTPQGSVFGTKTTDAWGNVTFEPTGQQTDPRPLAAPDTNIITLVNNADPTDVVTGDENSEVIKAALADKSKNYVIQKGGQTINVGAQKVEAKEKVKIGELRATRINDTFLKPANEATTTLSSLDMAINLMNQSFEQGGDDLTGFGIEFITDLQAGFSTLSNMLGFDVSELGINVETIKDRQTLRSELNKLVLGQTQKLKGALSNKELDFSAKATANMGNTPEANFLILTIQKLAAEKMQLAATAADDWAERNGTYGKGKDADGNEYSSFESFWRAESRKDEFIGPQLINQLNSSKQIEAYLDIKGIKKTADGSYTDEALSKLSQEELDAITAKLGSFNQ